MILLLQATVGMPVFVVTDPANDAVKAIMARLGFAPDDALWPYQLSDSSFIDSLVYRCGPDTHPPVLS